MKFRERAKKENTFGILAGKIKPPKREKERKIREVVIKVGQWRRLYTEQNVPLELAADKVGIPKKTLDDYFSQIK